MKYSSPFQYSISYFFLLYLLLLPLSCSNPSSSSTTNSDRVAQARQDKQEGLIQLIERKGMQWEKVEVFLRAFKEEQVLEVWGRSEKKMPYRKLLTYKFCQLSGKPGPKRKEGDRQVPEGLYHIDRFNPKSNYYLSLGLDYPNRSDKIRGDRERPGSDIFIHGDCVTVGCIPITDDKIKELYILTQRARDNGQAAIPVHIFPARLDSEKIKQLGRAYPQHRQFWAELKVFYDHFEGGRRPPKFTINAKGQYQLR
ncbi:MAG: L,D-transpeptidase family protein [Bacteroidota bacterium]